MHVYTTHDYIGLFFLLYIYVYGDFLQNTVLCFSSQNKEQSY